MSTGDAIRKAAAGAASVAMATAGLSSCKNGGGLGAVDPPPPPLQCNTVSLGQTLEPRAALSGDSVSVTVRNLTPNTRWSMHNVVGVTGATVRRVIPPAAGTNNGFEVIFALDNATSANISFTLEARLEGATASCNIRRTFLVTVTPAGVQIAQLTLDQLPLPARQRAEIVMLERAGRTVTLEVRTPYRGSLQRMWEVSEGILSDSASAQVQWTLPAATGIYAAEVVLDFGADGLAFDALMLEVMPDDDAA